MTATTAPSTATSAATSVPAMAVAQSSGAALRENLRLPWVAQQAVFDLSAPWQQWRTRQDMVAWAETRLRFRVRCFRGRHRVQVDPHTGTFTDVFRTPSEREKVEANHLVWGMQHPVPAPPPPCRTFETVLATWVGYAQPPSQSLWEPQWHGTMQALRTVVRTVQYLDAELDLHAHRRWLELGLTPTTLTTVLTAVADSRIPDAEERVLDDLARLTSERGRLSRQRKDATQELTVTLTKALLRQMAKRAHG